MKPAQFVLANASTIASVANSHGPQPPQLTGDDLHDQSLFNAWLAAIALLANGVEPGCHDGSTFAARRDAAKQIVEAYQANQATARIIRHRDLPIEAPSEFWTAMKWQLYSNNDVAGPRAFDNSGEADKLLAIAVTKGLTGASALAFVAEEIDRKAEVASLTSAMRNEGSAVAKLADALKAENEDSVLARIMSRLSEKTQYAVRQQLKG